MGLYNVKVSPYVPNPIRCLKCQKFGHGKGNVRGNLNVLSVERKITRASIARTIRSAPIVVNLTWLHPKIVNISLEKKKSKR
jgi:hypothetical protein